jgi:hypothetical protein
LKLGLGKESYKQLREEHLLLAKHAISWRNIFVASRRYEFFTKRAESLAVNGGEG